MPATANGNWSWNVLTWTGTLAYSSDTSTITSGNWWEDVLDSGSFASSLTDTSLLNDLSSLSSKLPGLDVVPVIGVLTLASVAAIVQKRRKNKDI